MSEATQVDTRIELKPPSMWTVVFFNDDYTPMVFVEYVLMEVFHKNAEDAKQITLQIHETGSARVGKYTKEVALNKADTVIALAQYNQHLVLQVQPERIESI